MMNGQQVKGFVVDYWGIVREFDFDNVVFIRGSWDDVLGLLVDKEEGGSFDSWLRKLFVFVGLNIRFGIFRINILVGFVVVNLLEDEVVILLLVVVEVSRELFEVDLEGMVFGGVNDVDNFEVGVEEWVRGVIVVVVFVFVSNDCLDDYDDVVFDIEVVKQVSEGFSMMFRKRRLRKKRRYYDYDEEDECKSQKSIEKEKEKSICYFFGFGKSSSKFMFKYLCSCSDEMVFIIFKEIKDCECFEFCFCF